MRSSHEGRVGHLAELSAPETGPGRSEVLGLRFRFPAAGEPALLADPEVIGDADHDHPGGEQQPALECEGPTHVQAARRRRRLPCECANRYCGMAGINDTVSG